MSDRSADSYASMLNSVDNLSHLFMDYIKEKKEDAVKFAKKIDAITLVAKNYKAKAEADKKSKKEYDNTDIEKKINELLSQNIDSEAIVYGLFSSPAGSDAEYILASAAYMRQKISEMESDLTLMKVQEIRDTFFVRLAEDLKIWDNRLGNVMGNIMTIVQNISAGFKQDRGNRNVTDPNAANLLENKNDTEKKENKSQKYNI